MRENVVYEFGRFRIDASERVLSCKGAPISLPPKAIDTLLLLLGRPGLVVAKGDLLAAVWPDVFVEENNLTQYISLLRKTLGDERGTPQYIETVSRRGYRFCCPVERLVLGVSDALGASDAPDVEAEVPANELAARPRVRSKFGRPWAIAAAVMLGFAAAFVVGIGMRGHPPLLADSGPSPASVAVLPYEMPAGDGRHDASGIALADDLIRYLDSRNGGLRLLPPSAIYGLAGLHVPPAEAARRLNANFVLIAKLEQRKTGAVLDAKLIRAKDGSAVWSETIKGDANNLFALQDRLSSDLQKAIAGSAGRSADPPQHITQNLRAYESYIGGQMYLGQRSSEGIYKSIDAFEQATAEDPRFALAFASLAEADALDITGWKKSEAAAQKALALDPLSGEAHVALGLVAMLWRNDFEHAAAEFKTAIRLNSRDASAHLWYADNFASQNRLVEAAEEMHTARDLDPYSAAIKLSMAKVYYLDHEYDAALEQCQQVLMSDPAFLQGHILLHDIYIETQQYDKAMAEFNRIEELAGGSGLYPASRAQALNSVYAKNGIKGFWRARVEFLKTEYQDDYQLAKYLALLGRRRESLASLQRAIDIHKAGHTIVLFAYEEPVFAGMRYDPRFRQLTGFN
jgi:DNA-binding winged helix-turn-helix (wHTH) protein/TolB-like protein/cytochrome c-type biogenesis protein CcmH/NrfG